MIDILKVEDGMDLGFAQSILPKAKNVLSVQLQDLEYAPTFGVDKRYFLNTPILFQNESYKSYLIKRLSEHGISVNEVAESVSSLFSTLSLFVSEQRQAAQFSTQEIISNALSDADGAFLVDADGAPLIDGIL